MKKEFIEEEFMFDENSSKKMCGEELDGYLFKRYFLRIALITS